MDSVVYVVDNGYNCAFRLVSYKEYESATEGTIDEDKLNFDAFVWNEEYSDLTKWLGIDTYYNANRMFLMLSAYSVL